MTGWQPIETAPKDRRILGWGLCGFENEPGAATVKWCPVYQAWNVNPNESTEYSPESCALTHWQELPEPPK